MNLKNLLDTFDDNYYIFIRESVNDKDLFIGFPLENEKIKPYLNRKVTNITLDLWEEDIVIVVSENDYI